MLLACVLSGLAWLCLYQAVNDTKVEERERIAFGPRKNLTSTVIGRGVVRSGTCGEDDDIAKALPGVNFGDCEELDMGGRCQEVAATMYETMFGSMTGPAEDLPIGPQSNYDLTSCTNVYQVWLKVQLEGPVPIRRCAYRFGFERTSQIGCTTIDWKNGPKTGCRQSANLASEVYNAFPVNSVVHAWGIDGDSEGCVVGFQDPNTAVRAEAGAAKLVASVGLLLAMSAAMLCIYSTCGHGEIHDSHEELFPAE